MSFRAFLQSIGLQPGDVVPDGEVRRCPTDDHPRKKNGAYLLFPGGRFGWGRDWALHSDPVVWKDNAAGPITERDLQQIREHQERQKQRRREAVVKARELWAVGAPYEAHPYLTAKGLSAVGCEGLKVWTGDVWTDEGRVHDTWLLVPMRWRGSLVNVQRISTDGLKRQITRAPQIGCVHVLDRKNAALTVYVEGFATGLAVFQCLRWARVVVTFYVDNLSPVLTRELPPAGPAVIAADNDWKTFAKRGTNPGIEKAKAIADEVGCGVVWPEGIEGSDWADALREWSGSAKRRIERLIQSQARYVVSSG